MKILIILAILAVAYLLYRSTTIDAVVELPAKDGDPEAEPVVKTMSNSIKAALGISIIVAAIIAVAFLM
jgi:hypothetical protein